MPKSTRKSGTAPRRADLPEMPYRAGLPAKDSIIAVTTPAPTVAARGVPGTQYRVIHTNETDEYEKGAAVPRTLDALVAAAPTGDTFKGTDRKAAKLSIGTGKMARFKDVRELILSLAPERRMTAHTPRITTGTTSGRVKEEQRNVHVGAFLYAASRENDNDFHLILGRDPQAMPEMYMTMELSGLPPAKSPSFKKLKAARDAFTKFYNDHLGGTPGLGYDFPDPPIPVAIEGSLFFDITHATGLRPGPKSLKSRMPVIWEVHPITKIVFEP